LQTAVDLNPSCTHSIIIHSLSTHNIRYLYFSGTTDFFIKYGAYLYPRAS
jgi:hypothetical protein